MLEQPEHFAYQVFDKTTLPLLRGEYHVDGASRVVANSLEELASKLEGVSVQGFLDTVREFNDAVDCSVPFDPSVKDGRTTRGLEIDKTNWANAIEQPPVRGLCRDLWHHLYVRRFEGRS